eukprot:jgi/Tetstr1/450207/TSEL_037246.t1
MCSKGRILEGMRLALFRGRATYCHIRVHPAQPRGEDAFDFALLVDITDNYTERKQNDEAGKKHMRHAAPEAPPSTPPFAGSDMGNGVKNASVEGPCHTPTRQGLESTLKAEDKAVLSAVCYECWPRDTQTGIPNPLKKTPRFPIAAPPYTERICYATFNFRAGYTAETHFYDKETVIAGFREYTPLPLPPNTNATILVDCADGAPCAVSWKHGNKKKKKKRAGGITKHNTNAVKNMTATQAIPGDNNVDEGITLLTFPPALNTGRNTAYILNLGEPARLY